jgi:hypothetical protein
MLEIFISDVHFPFEDPAAYALVEKVIKKIQPDILFLGGDIVDMYAVSSHDKDPSRATPRYFQEEIEYSKEKLTKLRKILPNAEIYYKEGNHETRLTRFLLKNAPVLYGMKQVSLPYLLGLNELNIKWIKNGQRKAIGKLHHLHGNEIGGAGDNPAATKFKRMQCNFIFGHHHTQSKYSSRAYDGNIHAGFANPCLCDLEPEYLHHSHNWSHGFSVIDYAKNGDFQLDQIQIVKPGVHSAKAACMVRGIRFEVDLKPAKPSKKEAA